jgi:ribonuclease HI
MLTEGNIKRSQAVTLLKNSEAVIGKIQRKPNFTINQEITIRHFVRETHDTIPSSVIVPCKGCDITEEEDKDRHNDNIPKVQNKLCLFKTHLEELTFLPVSHVQHSSSNSKDKRKKFRAMISSKSNQTYLENQSFYKELHNKPNINAEFYLNNIFITDNSLNSNMLRIQSEISTYKNFDIYTDGSLNTPELETSGPKYHRPALQQMGIGIKILTDQSNNSWELSASVTGSPSSTRAEVWAVLIALKLLPPNSVTNIHTDSMSCINTIKGFDTNTPKKFWKKYTNPHLIQIFSEIKKINNLEITLIKVDAHSGNTNNDRADQLAKLETHGNNTIKVNRSPDYVQMDVQTCRYPNKNTN